MERNMDPKRCPMPSQAAHVRNKNFDEVALGYTPEMAVNEAKRCLHCKNMPCVSGCPVGIHIPEFIEKIAEEDFEGAYQVLSASSALPAVCGRVCPQENQCEGKCVRGIKGESVGIGRLERFAADWHRTHSTAAPKKPAPNGHKVAIIGSGPSGLTAAGELAKKGYAVTVFEALHLAGGVLVYGIPEFRLPKDIVQQEIDGLKALGVSREDIVEDYLLTNACRTTGRDQFRGMLERAGLPAAQAQQVTEIATGVRRESIESALDAIEEKYPSFEEYLRAEFEIGAAELEDIRARYLV